MKKYLPVLAIVCICQSISCTSKVEGGLSPTAQKNLDAMHAITQTFETKDFSKLGDYIAADAVDHSGDNGDIKGGGQHESDVCKRVHHDRQHEDGIYKGTGRR